MHTENESWKDKNQTREEAVNALRLWSHDELCAALVDEENARRVDLETAQARISELEDQLTKEAERYATLQQAAILARQEEIHQIMRANALDAELAQWQQWEDKPDELSEAIDACHPMKTKTHDLYAKANELVSNRHSKGALVGLVHYLLCQEDKAIKAQCDLIAVLEKMATCDSNYGAHAFEYREMASVALAVLAKGKGGQS